MSAQELITDHLDLWTGAVTHKRGTGRGASSKNGNVEFTGIKKLRELILELAVRGKLVEQDPSDEPASVLLERVAEEKARLIKDGKIKKPRKLPPLTDANKPFSLPERWEWTQIEAVGHDWGQKEPDQVFSYIDVSSIDNIKGIIDQPEAVSPSNAPSRARKKVRQNTVVYSTVRPYLKNIAVIDKKIEPEPIASTAFAIVSPLSGIPAKYLLHYLRSPVFVRYVESVQTGIAYPAINDKQFFSGALPVPPLQEQHRIVEKVDELMALCDRLEQQVGDQLEAHKVLVDTLLDALTRSTDPAELAENWGRVAEHFDTLFTTEASIEKLKQVILQLAVMGRLVEQDPNDEPASLLLDKIAEEKARLVKEGKIKPAKYQPPLTEDKLPYSLPHSWSYCRISDVGEVKLGRQRSPKDHTGTNMTPYLRVANVLEDKIDTSDIKEMNFTEAEKNTFSLFPGDVLLNEGQSRELVGRPAVYQGEVPGACFQNTLLRFRAYDGVIPEYANKVFLAYLHNGRFQNAATQTTNIAHLSAGRLSPIEFPLPPQNEQKRIIEKVDELTALCNQLKARLGEASETRAQLAETVVEQAVS
ncbi:MULTISPECIES: restriction endonuclease subunit S [unclassified Halomonas]|uniref:restriction endonuclease subunit S n=1 Tax=unclassified Halomonas TaxID=2609666 RepID=UPI001EF4BD9A|nr:MULTISPECIES: restriction endonuclease subunit S [unclassified Halomonas]MCG7590015.1 restriction endonuclease subunit S [Halomonas sp. McD50-5]MCG7615935.1 restriction endonuclease subunit S [Halomonas sp. McD50-4]